MLFRTRRTPYWLTFAVLALSVCSYTLMQSLTVPVLPDLVIELDTTQATATWILTAYLLSASVFTPIAGRLGDIFGKQRLLVLSLLALSIGSLIAAVAPNVEVLIAARAVQGIGGGVMPLAFGIIRDEFPSAKVPSGVSIISSLTAVGFGVGLVLAGPITKHLDFHWLFWLPFIVTAVLAVVAILVVPESPVRTPGKVAVGPAFLLSGWLICLLLALSQAPQWGWLSPGVLALGAAALILLVIWVRVELTVAVPLIDMKMMRLPGVWTTNLVALLMGIGMYASFGFAPQFIQTPSDSGYGFGASITETGMISLPMAFLSFVAGIIAAPMSLRIGAKTVVVLGSVISAGGMLVLAVAHDEIWQAVVGNALAGLGIGLSFACLASLIVAAVPPSQTGVASGMNANIRTIGGSIGTAVMASIVTSNYLPNGFPEEAGYTIGFLVLTVAMILAAVASLLIPGVSRKKFEHDLVDGPVAAVAH